MLFYNRLCLEMKVIWINEVRKRQDKQGYSIYSAQIPTMNENSENYSVLSAIK